MDGLTGEVQIKVNLRQLYDKISEKIRSIIADKKLTPDNIRTIY